MSLQSTVESFLLCRVFWNLKWHSFPRAKWVLWFYQEITSVWQNWTFKHEGCAGAFSITKRQLRSSFFPGGIFSHSAQTIHLLIENKPHEPFFLICPHRTQFIFNRIVSAKKSRSKSFWMYTTKGFSLQTQLAFPQNEGVSLSFIGLYFHNVFSLCVMKVLSRIYFQKRPVSLQLNTCWMIPSVFAYSLVSNIIFLAPD